MKTKFKVGDVLQRCDSPAKETFLVLDIYEDRTPFCTKVWYCAVDSHGHAADGLVSVIDKCFTKLFNVC